MELAELDHLQAQLDRLVRKHFPGHAVVGSRSCNTVMTLGSSRASC